MAITAARWYDYQPDTTQHYQGDIVKDIPFFTFPASLPASKEEVWPILRPVNAPGVTIGKAMRRLPVSLMGHAAKDVPDCWTDPEGEWIAAHSLKQNVLIISRSCALDNPSRKHVLVAPVIAVSTLPAEQRQEGKIAALQNNEIPHFFYLPPTDGFEECYADLLRLMPIHRTFFPDGEIAAQLRLRLSSLGMSSLQAALSKHFGTQFGFSENDVCQQTALYACMNCFSEGRRSDPHEFPVDHRFGKCPSCGEYAAWIKLRGE